MSASLVSGPKLIRRKPFATSCGTPIAASTTLPFIAPDEQALPAETAIPARSNCTSSDALAAPGSETAPMVGMRGLLSPMITPPESFTPVRAGPEGGQAVHIKRAARPMPRRSASALGAS